MKRRLKVQKVNTSKKVCTLKVQRKKACCRKYKEAQEEGAIIVTNTKTYIMVLNYCPRCGGKL